MPMPNRGRFSPASRPAQTLREIRITRVEIILVGDPGKETRYVCGSDGNFHPLPTKMAVHRLPGSVILNTIAP